MHIIKTIAKLQEVKTQMNKEKKQLCPECEYHHIEKEEEICPPCAKEIENENKMHALADIEQYGGDPLDEATWVGHEPDQPRWGDQI